MKKKKKKLKKNVSKNKNKRKTKKIFKKSKKRNIKKTKVKQKKTLKKSKIKKTKKVIKKFKSIKPKQTSFLLKLINFQNSLKPEIKFKINLGFEKYIQAFFDKISDTISQYRVLKKDEARRLKLEKQEKERFPKLKVELNLISLDSKITKF